MQTEIHKILNKANIKNISTLEEKWNVGRIIELFYESKKYYSLYRKEICKFIAKYLKISLRQVYRCRQFFRTFQSSNWKEALQIIPLELSWHNFVNEKGSIDSFISEKFFNALIVKQLKRDGWDVETEKQTPIGRIDIFASTRVSSRIIEVKGSNSVQSIRKAFGQLIFYKEYYTKADAFIAIPALPPKNIKNILDKYRIKIIWLTKSKYLKISG